MTSVLFVVACGRRKLDHPAAARDLYTSAHFGFVLAGVEREAAATRELGDDTAVRILSARYGLVDPDSTLPPYDTTIGDDEAITPGLLAGQLLPLAGGDQLEVSAFLPRAYLAVLRDAAELVPEWLSVAVYDVFEDAPGIGYQRQVIANLGKRSTS